MSTPVDTEPGRSRFSDPPVFEVVGYVEMDALTAAAPNQARAPKGTPIGGQWIETAKAMLDVGLQWLTGGEDVESRPGLVESNDAMARPTLGEKEIAEMRRSYVTGQHIDENGEFTPERKEFHEQVVNEFLDGVPSQEPGEAEVWFNGGGPGSGKGSFTNGRVDVGYPTTRSVNDMTGEMDFAGMANPGAVLIDPDSVKMQFPEVKAMRQTQVDLGDLGNMSGPGGNWAGQSHEESSYLAKMIYMEAQRRNVNIVYDGTGTKIVGKAQEALNSGYKAAHANYMYVEADQALESAISRAGRIGRNVPPTMQADQYKIMPNAFEDVASSGVFQSVNLFDRNGVPQGQDIPRIFEILPNGERHILDQAAYDKFLSSGSRVPNVG